MLFDRSAQLLQRGFIKMLSRLKRVGGDLFDRDLLDMGSLCFKFKCIDIAEVFFVSLLYFREDIAESASKCHLYPLTIAVARSR